MSAIVDAFLSSETFHEDDDLFYDAVETLDEQEDDDLQLSKYDGEEENSPHDASDSGGDLFIKNSIMNEYCHAIQQQLKKELGREQAGSSSRSVIEDEICANGGWLLKERASKFSNVIMSERDSGKVDISKFYYHVDVITRDVVWLDFERPDPKRDMSNV